MSGRDGNVREEVTGEVTVERRFGCLIEGECMAEGRMSLQSSGRVKGSGDKEERGHRGRTQDTQVGQGR